MRLLASVVVFCMVCCGGALAAPVSGEGSLPAGFSVDERGGERYVVYSHPEMLPIVDGGYSLEIGGVERDAVRGESTLSVQIGADEQVTTPRVLVGGVPLDHQRAKVVPAQRSTSETAQVVAVPELPAALQGAKRYDSTTRDYRDGEFAGHIVEPVDAGSRRPLVVFVHGNSMWCHKDGRPSWQWPCADGAQVVPSYLGFHYAQEVLARQGFSTLSVDVNSVNATTFDAPDKGMAARAELVSKHLAALGSTMPSANPHQVFLVGHSRGGEGVYRTLANGASSSHATIRGALAVAPTNFAESTAHSVPFTTLLSTCDGDVAEHVGQYYTDRALGARRSSRHSTVTLRGANHRFYNTEWTPGLGTAPIEDDANWRCEGGRLTAEQQRTAFAGMVSAHVRAVLLGDRESRRFAEGRESFASALGLPFRTDVAAVAGASTTLWQGNKADTPSATVSGGTNCQPIAESGPCSQDGDFKWQTMTHWLIGDGPHAAHYPRGASERALVFAQPVSLRGTSSLRARVIVPAYHGVKVSLRVTDTSGRSADLQTASDDRVCGFPCGDGEETMYWPQALAQSVVADLTSTGDVDLSAITRLDLIVDGDDIPELLLLDVESVRKVPWNLPFRPRSSPRIDLPGGGVTAPEGDAPTTHTVPLTFSPATMSSQRVLVERPWFDGRTPETITVPAGTSVLPIDVTVPGDTTWSPRPVAGRLRVTGYGDLMHGIRSVPLTVTQDETAPTLSAQPEHVTAKPGQDMEWKVTIAGEPPHEGFTVSAFFVAPDDGEELTVGDVAESSKTAWNVGSDTAADTPWSQAARPLDTNYDPTSKTLTYRLSTTASATAARSVKLIVWLDGPFFRTTQVVTGTVAP